MKTLIRTLLVLLFATLLASCATTSAGNHYIEKKQNQEKLLFEDWKYKGFGQELPVWFDAAYENESAKIKKLVTELSDSELLILQAEGINSDQADKLLKIQEADASDFILYDSCWAMHDGKYIAIALMYKEIL